MLKKYFFILLVLLVSCKQKPAEVVYKRSGIYTPNYTEVYVESPDGKIARSLRGSSNTSRAQEVSIIKQEEMPEITNAKYYKAELGDSLWLIAKKHNMTVAELASMNNIEKPYNIRAGQMIRVAGTEDSSIKRRAGNYSSSRKITYTVKNGDNLSSIARDYGMMTKDLADLNGIEKPYNLKVGQKLTIMDNNSSYAAAEPKKTAPQPKSNGIYVVKSGDNLSTIAERHNMSLGEIASLNNISRPYNISVGQKIKVSKNASTTVASSNKKTTTTSSSTTAKTTKTSSGSSSTAKTSGSTKNSFAWPIRGNIVSSFGSKSNGLYNDGINISATKGSDFRATDNGVVAYVGNELRSYGTIILVKHSNNWISAYAHCDSVKVARGDRVEKGQVLGTVGQSGNVSSPQLYFSLRNGREAVDPLKYLD